MKASDWRISEDLGPDSPIWFQSFRQQKTSVKLFPWPEKVEFIVTLCLQASDEYNPLSPEASENPDAYLHFSAK